MDAICWVMWDIKFHTLYSFWKFHLCNSFPILFVSNLPKVFSGSPPCKQTASHCPWISVSARLTLSQPRHKRIAQSSTHREDIPSQNCVAGPPLKGVIMLQPSAASWWQHIVKTIYKLGLSFFSSSVKCFCLQELLGLHLIYTISTWWWIADAFNQPCILVQKKTSSSSLKFRS